MKTVRLILVVEDDDTLRYLVMRQLKKLGHAAHYAVNGEEAVRMIQEHHYDMILMDVMMPVMDGIEATLQIRLYEQRERLLPTPILAMTAFQEKALCAQAGMDEYLYKPVLLDDLERALNTWLPPNGTTHKANGTSG